MRQRTKTEARRIAQHILSKAPEYTKISGLHFAAGAWEARRSGATAKDPTRWFLWFIQDPERDYYETEANLADLMIESDHMWCGETPIDLRWRSRRKAVAS